MALRVSKPLETEFKLDKSDPEGQTFVLVRQAKQAEIEAVAGASIGYIRQIADPESGATVSVRYPPSRAEMKRRRIEATLIGCNILDETELPLFKFKITEKGVRVLDMDSFEFAAALGRLDMAVVDEIHDKVLEANPRWGAQGEAG